MDGVALLLGRRRMLASTLMLHVKTMLGHISAFDLPRVQRPGPQGGSYRQAGWV